MVSMLNEIPGVVCAEPLGAFYAYPSVKALLGREMRGTRPATSAELAELVLDEAEVAVVPGEAFGTPGYFRLSYALGDDDLVEGVNRLGKLLERGAANAVLQRDADERGLDVEGDAEAVAHAVANVREQKQRARTSIAPPRLTNARVCLRRQARPVRRRSRE